MVRPTPEKSLIAKCMVQRLSHMATEPFFQRNRQVNSGYVAWATRVSNRGFDSSGVIPSNRAKWIGLR